MLFLAPKWWPTTFVTRSLALREAELKGERGLRAPGEGCVLLRATATSKAAAAKCRPRRHQSHSTIGSKHRRHRRLRSHRWPSPADGWLKALDFTGQGAGRRSNGVIISSPIETRQAPTSVHQPMGRQRMHKPSVVWRPDGVVGKEPVYGSHDNRPNVPSVLVSFQGGDRMA